MRAVIPVLLVMVLAVLIVVIARSSRVRKPALGGISGPVIPAIDQAAYRNHLAMARWIEGRLGDDLIRSALDEQDHARARKLLEEFYGEEPE